MGMARGERTGTTSPEVWIGRSGNVSHVKELPMTVPTKMAMRITRGGMIAMGNPGKALAGRLPMRVRVGIRNRRMVIAEPDSLGGVGSLRNLAEALVGGVIMNMASKCRGILRMGNMNCETTGSKGGLALGLNCSRPIRVVSPRKVRAMLRKRGGVAIGNVSGRGIKRFTTRVESGEEPRPCGNGKVGCTSRMVEHGINGANGGWVEEI